jgi:hypothetical protein
MFGVLRSREEREVRKYDNAIEILQSQVGVLEGIFVKARQENRLLNHRKESKGAQMSASEYMLLKAEIEQSDTKLASALKNLQERQRELEDARAVEQAKLEREIAKREYETTLSEFNHVRTVYLQQKKQAQELSAAIEVGSKRHSELLAKLNEKTIACKTLGVEVTNS